ncbi:MAG: FAD binding domain-containing protein [Acidimicrobiales bacterium]
MHQLTGYHRPATVEEALNLLDGTRVVLAGGTTIRHDGGGPPVEVVDLQNLGLDTVNLDGDRIELGAMVTLQSLVDDDRVPELIRTTARAELPSTLRTLATVGGTIATGGGESVFLAALLVHDVLVHFADGTSKDLRTVLRDGVGASQLIVGINATTGGTSAMAGTGRTPADIPIVAAVGREANDHLHIAVCGVAATPLLVDPVELDQLDPPADFRGSSDYRRHLAKVLTARVVEELS